MLEKKIHTQLSELLTEKDYRSVKTLLTACTPQDIALLLDDVAADDVLLLFRLLPKELAAETFVEMDSDLQERLLQNFTDTELRGVIAELFVDDMVNIIEEMPANVVKRILASADAETRAAVNEILHYPPDSAGSIMTTEYVRLSEEMTVEDAFARIRREGVDKETIYTCYVTAADRRLIGLVTVKTLLLSDKATTVGEIMERNVISVRTDTDRELVAQELSKYDFLAMPVTDGENRLVGIVTFDDAIDVMQEEATEDIEKMAAITPTDKPYLKTGVVESFIKRIPWLCLLMISATFTGAIITYFEDALAKAVILTAFIPMLMDTGGNAGSQSSVTIIRGLSLGEISMRDILRILWKEMRVALLCGVALGIVGFGKLMLLDQVGLRVALVVCFTLVVTVLTANLVGATLPMLAKRLGFDPAVMASPFITTIVDALSLLFFFNIASMLIPELRM
ncbi:MAG TPA: magnesium transporter [Firmicutes bacterium]|nr:magnesium transporter [Bacillota bacterium]